MAKLLRVKNKEERLIEKKRVRYLFTFDRLLMIAQTVAIIATSLRYFNVL